MQKYGKNLWTSFIFGSLAGFQMGYNLGDTNLIEPFIRCWIQQTESSDQFISCENADTVGQNKTTELYSILEKSTAKWSLAVSIYAIGAMAGSLLAGPTANKIGRKPSILLNAILNVLSCTALIFLKQINSYYLFLIIRILLGVNTGFCTCVTPLYLGEISPKQLAGPFGASFQLMVSIGILVGQAVGLKWIFGTETLWPYCLAFCGIFGAIQIILYFFSVETPSWLILQGNIEGAKISNEKLNGKNCDLEIAATENQTSSESAFKNIKQIFSDAGLKRGLFCIVMYFLAFQLSGINAVIFYSGSIFVDAGVPSDLIGITTLGVGLLNIVGVLLAIVLINKTGRLTLFSMGLAVMCLMCILITVLLSFPENPVCSYLVIIPVLVYVFMFNLGPGPVPWMLSGEYMPTEFSAGTQAIGSLTSWLGCFFVGLIFPPLQDFAGQYSFIFFAVACGFFGVFIKVYGVESKGKSVEQVQMIFKMKAAESLPK